MSFWSDILPNILSCVVGAVSWLICHAFNVNDEGLTILLSLMLIDWVTGVVGAYLDPKEGLCSSIGARGIAKKFVMLVAVSFGHILDIMFDTGLLLQQAFTYMYIGNECLSIVENLGQSGVPIPDTIRDKIQKLKRSDKS